MSKPDRDRRAPASSSASQDALDRMRRLGLGLGAVTAAIAAMALVGWILEIEALRSVIPDHVSMKANTAIGIGVAGVAVGIAAAQPVGSPAPALVKVLGGGALAIGLVTLVEYAFDWGTWFDELLFDDPDAIGTSSPGRPAATTAVGIASAGLALMLIDVRPGRLGPAAPLGALAALLGAVALTGHAVGVDAYNQLPGSTQIAIPTAAALVLVGAGIVCARPERPLVRAFVEPTPAGALLRFLFPAALLVPIAVGVARSEGQPAGAFGTEVGILLMVLSFAAFGAVISLVSAARLEVLDARRRVLAEETGRLAAIVESSRDAIVGCDLDGQITSWNEGATRLYGYSAAEAAGREVTMLVPEERSAELRRSLEYTATHGRSVELETMRLSKGGERAEVSLTVSPVHRSDGNGEVVAMAVTGRDLSELRRAERLFRGLLDGAPDAMVICDESGEIVRVNAQAENLLWYSADEMVGQPVEMLVPEAVRDRHRGHRARYLSQPERRTMGRELELAVLRRDGSEVPVEISLSPLETPQGLLFSASIRDISERKRAEAARRQAEERFERAFADSGVAMALVAASGPEVGRFVEANGALRDLTGYTREELLATEIEMITHPDDLAEITDQVRRLLAGELRTFSVEHRILTRDRSIRWVDRSTSIVHGGDREPRHLLVQLQDISARKRFEGELQYLADHDSLTGLFNRHRFEQELERELASARRYETGGALLVLDLDNFKYVNDSLGHAAGDELITAIGHALRERLRETDILGRLGGDEFAIIVPHADEPAAVRVAEQVRRLIHEDVAIEAESGPVRAAASVGVAMFPEASVPTTAQDLLAAADIAMYDAKEEGRDRVNVFRDESARQTKMEARLRWAERIRAALLEEGFELWAQPIAALSDGLRSEPEKYELLLRMRGAGDDLILPGTFLYIAERFNLIQEIDRWVVSRAVERLADAQAGGVDVCLAINLSAKSITDPEMVGFIAGELERHEADPSGLVIEVTETAAIVNVDRAKRFASELGKLGCRFALDDFGSGFASFYYLKHLTFDYLKIDGEFIRHLAGSATDQLVVRSLVAIARGLGRRTVAECVEGPDTLRLLREFGVDFAQGYHVGRPRPLAELDLTESARKHPRVR